MSPYLTILSLHHHLLHSLSHLHKWIAWQKSKSQVMSCHFYSPIPVYALSLFYLFIYSWNNSLLLLLYFATSVFSILDSQPFSNIILCPYMSFVSRRRRTRYANMVVVFIYEDDDNQKCIYLCMHTCYFVLTFVLYYYVCVLSYFTKQKSIIISLCIVEHLIVIFTQ